jgi:MerR family transcriptional regulator, thiopeptide resistance regulator
MQRRRTFRVKEVAIIARVSVRALHHYDEIGLLVPSGRTQAGYRLYDENDLLRLQQIVIGRALGLPLEEIRRSLDDPEFDERKALLAQKGQLQERNQRTTRMILAIEAALAALETKGAGDAVDMRQIFDGLESSQYEEEAKQRWGNSDAYKESQRRTKQYTEDDWKKIGAEQATIYADAVVAEAAGKKPSDDDVMDVAERHRLSIDRWFYPCNVVMHLRLADLFESDRRFSENIDKHGPGLTMFLVEAIRANGRCHGG